MLRDASPVSRLFIYRSVVYAVECVDSGIVGCVQDDAVDDAAEAMFLQLAEDTDDIPFAVTKSAEVFTEYKVSEPHVVIFKQVCIRGSFHK